tara:strand:- start:313 stop:576 length:264 start_codon:yes stop_codon:yes gene_type:complete
MYKLLNLICFIIVILFLSKTFIFYSSSKNIKMMSLNRLNIETILKDKTSNLKILDSNTNDVIEFNSSFSKKIQNSKPRSFWNLLKTK